MRGLAIVVVLVTAAHADPPQPANLPSYFAPSSPVPAVSHAPLEGTAPRFAFTPSDAVISPHDLADAAAPLSQYGSAIGEAVVGNSDSGGTWVATDISYGFPCGAEGCEKNVEPRVHGVALFDASDHAVAWSTGLVVAGTFNPHAPSPPIQPISPPRLADAIDAGAKDAVAAFKGSLGDAESLAKTVSDRKDTVMFGSELAERYVGGATVKATLRKWKLGFKVRDGIQAGIATKTTAWVAANVDATKPGDKKPTPYRVFAIYDKKGASWQLVALQFSTATNTKPN